MLAGDDAVSSLALRKFQSNFFLIAFAIHTLLAWVLTLIFIFVPEVTDPLGLQTLGSFAARFQDLYAYDRVSHTSYLGTLYVALLTAPVFLFYFIKRYLNILEIERANGRNTVIFSPLFLLTAIFFAPPLFLIDVGLSNKQFMGNSFIITFYYFPFFGSGAACLSIVGLGVWVSAKIDNWRLAKVVTDRREG